ncbi:MAG: hypothetical protein V7K83_16605 [Nostoc sp.]
MKPYSVDLREKVVNAYQLGNISVKLLSKHFLQKLLKWWMY